MIKKIMTISGLIIALAAVWGLLRSLDQYVAKAEQLKQVEMRLDQKIDADRVDRVQERIWKLEDRYEAVGRMPQSVKEEYRDLKQEQIRLEEKLKKSIEVK